MEMNIKDMLKNGHSADELMKVFQDQLNAAKAEIAAEQPTELDCAREAMVEALVDYLVELGIIEDASDEEIEKMTAAVEEAEKQLLAYADFMKKVEAKAKATKPSDDEALNDFLKKFCR